MCAEALSQDEIDALLRGQPDASGENELALAAEENEVVSRYTDLFRTTSEDVWSRLLGQEVRLELEKVESLDSDKLPPRCPEDLALLKTGHVKDVQGPLLVVVPDQLAATLGGAMTGSTGEFGELEQSALGDGQGQVFGTVCTQLRQKFKATTQMQPITVEVCRNSDELLANRVKELGERVIGAFFQMKVGQAAGPLLLVFSNAVIDSLMKTVAKPEPTPAAAAQPAVGEGRPGAVRPAVFDEFPAAEAKAQPANLSLILDIGLDIRVELGRTAMRIKEVLELGPGAVIELDKLAGEPVDLLVNDKLFARGEVVVIDENFGVRVTDIINIRERIEAMGDA